MNNTNYSNIKPITSTEIVYLMDVLRKSIKEGNGIIKFLNTVANLETETPVNYEYFKKMQSPSQTPTTIFSTSPIKTRKGSSGLYSSVDNPTTKFNNSKILTMVRFSLLKKFQTLVKYVNQLSDKVTYDINDIIESCLQCVIIVVSMSVIIEDRLASKEEAVSGKAKITVKGKKYVMDVIFRLRLYLINLLNDLKFVAADEILMKYSGNLSNPDLKSLQNKKQKNSKRLSEIINLIEDELKKYTMDNNINDFVMKGSLQKKRENEKFMSGFKKKYFVLTHKALMYSDKEISSNSTMGKFLMLCDYDCIKQVSEEEVKRKFCMRLFSHQDPKQSILLAASDEFEELVWFHQIRDKMYINSSYFTREDEDISEDIQDDSEQYRNLTNNELNELVRLINIEEKIKTNLVKHVFISKMNEIVKKISNQESDETNDSEDDNKKIILKLEKLRNDNMDLFLSVTTDSKQEDFMINLL